MQQQNVPISTLVDTCSSVPEIVQGQGQEALDSQLVPSAPEVLKLEAYREFLRVRRERLSERMNEFIRWAAGL